MPSIHINLIDVFNNVSMNLKIFGERALAKRRYEKKTNESKHFCAPNNIKYYNSLFCK